MDKAWVEGAFVGHSYILSVISQKGKRSIVVYDKANKKTYYSLIDDVDNIPISYLKNVFNNKIVQSFDIFKLLGSENKEHYSDKLKAVLNHVKETDNPILRVVTLKK